MIGKRLQLARKSSGLSLRDLSDRINGLVSAQAIGKYERDEMVPGSKVLLALANALNVSPTYLLSQSNLDLECVEFRKKSSTPKRDQDQVKSQVLDHIERYLQLEELLGIASLNWERPRQAPYPVKKIDDAERSANMLREHWLLGTDPIPSIPEFLEEKGVKVLFLPLPDKVDGLTCQVQRQNGSYVPVIVVNVEISGERKRFTLAHELGHLVQEVDTNQVDEEKAANRFAGAFLMPEETLWAEIGKNRSSFTFSELFELKARFGVSLAGIIYRCKDLGIISQSIANRYFAEFSKRGWRTPPYEPYPYLEKEPNRFKRLCMRALAENAISEAKTAELLGVSVRELLFKIEGPLEATI